MAFELSYPASLSDSPSVRLTAAAPNSLTQTKGGYKKSMETYLVGGAVRDKLLGIASSDLDYVVVGSDPDEMRARGYKQVGADFPVFLHPETCAEYALARTERKSGRGYSGFTVDFSKDVTLEEDLMRRDLTINAMAETTNGDIIDPHNGQEDLENKILRHVSPAFGEDPVRVLRVARFAARFHHFGFSVAEETLELMREMVECGEVSALQVERVWTELQRSFGEKNPEVFFKTLRDCNALKVIFPEIDALFGVPQPPTHHPEIDTGVHTLMVLQQARTLSDNPLVAFAAVCHDLGKGTTDKTLWPKHHGHEERGKKIIKSLCKRLKVPSDFRDLAMLTAQYHTHCHRAFELKPSTLLKTLEALDAFRRPERFELFLLACEADSKGRTGYETREYPQADRFRSAFRAAAAQQPKEIIQADMSGEQIKTAIYQARMQAIQTAIKD